MFSGMVQHPKWPPNIRLIHNSAQANVFFSYTIPDQPFQVLLKRKTTGLSFWMVQLA